MGISSSSCLKGLDLHRAFDFSAKAATSPLLPDILISPASRSTSSRSEDVKPLINVTSLAGELIASLPFRSKEQAVDLKKRIEKVDGTVVKSQKLLQGAHLLADADEVSCEPVTLVRMGRKMAITATSDKVIRFDDLDRGELLRAMRVSARVSCLAVDWHYLRCFSGGDQTIRVWNLRNGKCIHVLMGHLGWVCALRSDNEKWLVSLCREGVLKLWKLCDGLEESSIQIPGGKDLQLSVNWDTMLAMVANHTSAAVYELSTGRQHCSFATGATLIDFNWPAEKSAGCAVFMVPLDFNSKKETQGVLQLWSLTETCCMDHEFGAGCAWVACVDWLSERVLVAVARPEQFWWAGGTFRKLQAVGLQLWCLSTQTLLQTLENGLFDTPRSMNVDWELAKPRAVTCHEDVLLGDPTRFVHWDFEVAAVHKVKVGANISSLRGVVAVVVKP